MATKERVKEYLSYKKIGRNKFEDRLGIAVGYVSSKGVSISSDVIEKICEEFPELNPEWLITGKGDMEKQPSVAQTGGQNINVSGKVNPSIGNISDNHGVFGQVMGGHVEIQHHSDEGKDRLIETQERQVINMFSDLLEELKGFHEVGVRRDDRIKDQDTYIASIIKHSYIRNDENMKRMDELIRQQNEVIKGSNEDRKDMRKLIEQHDELIRIIANHNDKLQERADRLLNFLENKL